MVRILQGDWDKLQLLMRRVGELAGAAMQRELARRLADESLYQVRIGFEKSRNPYGKPWKPLAWPRRSDGSTSNPLRDTGRMMNSFTTSADSTGFRIGTGVVYAPVHQYGSRTWIPEHESPVAWNSRGRFMRHRDAKKRSGVNAALVRYSGHYVTIPQRQMVPEGDLGPIWRKALEGEAEAYVREKMGEAE